MLIALLKNVKGAPFLRLIADARRRNSVSLRMPIEIISRLKKAKAFGPRFQLNRSA